MSSKHELAALVALGITALLFESPTLGDVRLVAQGRLHLWPDWASQPDQVTERVARFLSHRPDDLAEDRPLLERLREAVGRADDFRAVEAGSEIDWDSRYDRVAGRSLAERLEVWLAELDKTRMRPATARRAAPTDSELVLVAEGTSYRIPQAHVPPADNTPTTLATSHRTDSVDLDLDALRALARRIDAAAMPGAARYETVAIEHFLERLCDLDGAPVRTIAAGVTRLAVAPTGTGKSVFARLLALHLASRGTPVALVVPDVSAVWKEVLRLQQAATAAELSIRVSALSSWRKTASHLAEHLEKPPKEDPGGAWALREMAYTCRLSAYAESAEDAPEPGSEPCTSLRQRECGRDKDTRVGCPFAGTCGRFAPFTSAATADIIVVNHHSLLAGRVPIEMAVDGVPRQLSTAELVLRRAVAVLVDEVDAFQNSAIGANSRGLALSSRGKLSKPIQLYTEVERRRAENRIDRTVRFERGRSALLRIMNEAERLSELVNREELDWPQPGRMTWREAHDAWIAARLYRDDDAGPERVRMLFDANPIEGDERSEELRRALLPLGPGLGDGTLMEEVHTKVMSLLHAWPMDSRPHELHEHRHGVASRLILRAVLVQLDRALGHLRPQLPALEQLEIRQAGELRDDLLGYAPWQPSPAGPLGKRLQGYAFAERGGELGALETRLLSGDPHGLVRELGGFVARALAGTPRVVLGLSATCRFRGAPRSDVLGEILGSVVDEARNLRVIDAPVEARISGVSTTAERIESARAAASQLWGTMLEAYLRDKLADDTSRGRARALLVTGSYAEAAAVADELRKVAGKAVQVRHVVRGDRTTLTADSDAITRKQLESFGHTAAPSILVGPLSVVARGHNILQPGTQLSAISGIFVLTRPVPPSHEADRFLAHVAYNAGLFPPSWRGTASATIDAERAEAWRRVRALQRSPATFRRMDPELRRELICDVLVDLAQLAGRARRGGTPVDLVFVDAAFQDEFVRWSRLVGEVLVWWKERGWFEEMHKLHGAFVDGLARYAGVDL